ncbi:MAG TPA: DUF2723 domain-containing protein [bacterium]|jgi:hypothetical protein|nr:DUF2723 domain-containing protein [bacterium]
MNPYPPTKLIVVLFIFTISVYLLTLNPALFRNDSPETITGCITLGITHPPGYPLFNLLGKCFLPFFVGNPAFTYNFMSSLLAASGACLLFINLWILLTNLHLIKKERDAVINYKSISCLAAALLFAVSNSYWGNAISAKGGIYILQMDLELSFFLFLQIVLFKEKPNLFDYYFSSFILLIGFINHWPSQTLLMPALLTLRLTTIKSQTPFSLFGFFKNAATCLTLATISFSLYLYLPIRSHLYPILNFGAPFTQERFTKSVLRTDYSNIEMMTSYRDTFWANLNQKSLYISRHFFTEFHPAVFVFIVVGFFLLNKANKRLTLFLLIFFLTVVLANLFYLQATPIEFWHIDDHLLSANWILSLLIGTGIYGLLTTTKPFLKNNKMAVMTTTTFCAFAIVFLTLIQNLATNDQKERFLYYGYGVNILKSMPENTLYFAESDYDYFSTLYFKTVLNKRPDIHLFLTFFIEQPYERSLLAKMDDLPTNPSPQTPKGSLLFDLIENNHSNHAIYSTFPNASFAKIYLKDFEGMRFEPSGIVTRIISNDDDIAKEMPYHQLDNFWNEYLVPELKKTNSTQEILLQACANPYLNLAHYDKLRGHFEHWDWCYAKALYLISDTGWLAQTWFDRAEGDSYQGKKNEAGKAYQIAGYYFYQQGQLDKSNVALKKAKALVATN